MCNRVSVDSAWWQSQSSISAAHGRRDSTTCGEPAKILQLRDSCHWHVQLMLSVIRHNLDTASAVPIIHVE
eukprot:6194735-Pleurochrysis_carterae.AAC.2